MVGGGSVDDEEGGAHDLSDANGGGGISGDGMRSNHHICLFKSFSGCL